MDVRLFAVDVRLFPVDVRLFAGSLGRFVRQFVKEAGKQRSYKVYPRLGHIKAGRSS